MQKVLDKFVSTNIDFLQTEVKLKNFLIDKKADLMTYLFDELSFV